MKKIKVIKSGELFSCDNNLYIIVNNITASQSGNLGNNQNIFKLISVKN
jgi:hypothetical protein